MVSRVVRRERPRSLSGVEAAFSAYFARHFKSTRTPLPRSSTSYPFPCTPGKPAPEDHHTPGYHCTAAQYQLPYKKHRAQYPLPAFFPTVGYKYP